MPDSHAEAQQRVAAVRERIDRLDATSLDLLFREARSHNQWTDKPVSDELLRELYELMAIGPTANNGCPARILFLRSAEAKERVMPALSPNNVPKVEAAPVTAIIGYDTEWFHHLPRLFAHNPEAAQNFIERFTADPDKAAAAGFRNGSLQGAYFIVAARALGLDVGPMSGFNNAVVDEAFFAGTPVKSNFLCNIGYGDLSGIFPRNPRHDFDDVCEIL